MANDRIWLVCRTCGREKLLAKYYPTLYSDPVPDVSEWALEHIHSETRGLDLRGDVCFDLRTESVV